MSTEPQNELPLKEQLIEIITLTIVVLTLLGSFLKVVFL